MFTDDDCDEGWKYDYNNNTFYCYHIFTGVLRPAGTFLCDLLYSDTFPKARLVTIESVEEHQFIIDNVPGNTLVYNIYLYYTCTLFRHAYLYHICGDMWSQKLGVATYLVCVVCVFSWRWQLLSHFRERDSSEFRSL